MRYKLSGVRVSYRAVAILVLAAASVGNAVYGQQDRNGARPRGAEGVKALRDIPYVDSGHERQKLDLYLPEKADGPFPLIIWVHGGGWQNGSKDGCPPLRAGYAARGYAVASIGYRLSGHAIFPAQIEDCKAAIRWLRAHATEYNLDPDRFGVWGSSAGGHLVALLGTSGDVKEFDVGANLDQSSRVQAVCDYYGPTDFIRFVQTPGYEGHANDGSPESKLLGGAVLDHQDRAARVNPITYVTKDDPPFLIVHGDDDRTVPLNQSESLFEALKQSGVSVHFHTIHGAGHGGPGFADPEVEKLVAKFFEKTLKAKTDSSSSPDATTSESTLRGSAPAPRPGDDANNRPAAGERGRSIPFDAILRREDANHDGKISRDEFQGPPPLFRRWDLNGDGILTRAEHEEATSNR